MDRKQRRLRRPGFHVPMCHLPLRSAAQCRRCQEEAGWAKVSRMPARHPKGRSVVMCSDRRLSAQDGREHARQRAAIFQYRISTAQLNVYPTPRSVTTNRGCDGSASILRRNRAT
jgi:hypothetical protein